jgi:hypothetical protein
MEFTYKTVLQGGASGDGSLLSESARIAARVRRYGD